jgi:ferredoxin-NADP reductase
MALSEPVAAASGVPADHTFHTLRVGEVVPETGDATSFVLEVPPDLVPTFAYRAGQFCTFRIRVDGQSHVRCYSMSSSPAVDADLRVTVKRTVGGVVSNWLNDHLAPGDPLEVAQPAGFFRLTEGTGDVVAFSAGSGITPVISLIKSALATTTRRVRLLYANRDGASIILRAEIDQLQEHHGERLIVSHHLDAERGLIRPSAIRPLVDDAEDPDVYLCGPAPFMEVVEGAVLAQGVDARRVHIERFTPAEWPADEDTINLAAARITVELGGRTETTDHRPGTTILQTARQLGMSPPFSCESGSCATCMAKLIEGSASMNVNNALTEDEVDDGWVLTCQALPTSPLLHVRYEEG